MIAVVKTGQKGLHLLMKRLAEETNMQAVVRGLREQEEVKMISTGAMVNETRQQLERQYTRHKIDLPPGRG
jgi:hypothetical protein